MILSSSTALASFVIVAYTYHTMDEVGQSGSAANIGSLLLEEKLVERGTHEWVERLNAKGVPSGAILSLREALQQPQIKHREDLKDVHIEGIGTVPLFTLTAKFEQTPGDITSPPPRLSEHTAEVLTGIGVTEEELATLKEQQVI